MENEYILIVDDDSDIRNLIGIYLENEGYKYIKCDNAVSALEAVETTKIALILLDVMMPQMDGITACMKLREKTNAPIIFISAKSEDMDIVSGLMSGGDDYVTKTFSPVQLMTRVKAQLRRYRQYSPSQQQAPKTTLEFEDITVSVPNNSDAVLRRIYGNYTDYPRDGFPHHGRDGMGLADWAGKSGTDMQKVIGDLRAVREKI